MNVDVIQTDEALMQQRMHLENLRSAMSRTIMIVITVLLASLNLSINPHYYRSAGLGAILIGLLGYLAINSYSNRIFKLLESADEDSKPEDDMHGVHLAFPVILIVGGLVVLVSASL